MNIDPIKSDRDYRRALTQIERLMDAHRQSRASGRGAQSAAQSDASDDSALARPAGHSCRGTDSRTAFEPRRLTDGSAVASLRPTMHHHQANLRLRASKNTY